MSSQMEQESNMSVTTQRGRPAWLQGVTAVASIAWSSRRRHRKTGPLVFAGGGSLAVIAGRLLWSAPTAVYVGVALIVIASLWNLVLNRRIRDVALPREMSDR